MGIFTRFRDIVSANINSMLDRAEDPEKMVSMMIREMEDTLVELKSSCAGIMAESKRIQRQLEQIDSHALYWEDKARLAIEKDRDDLAKEALLEKRRFIDTKLRLETDLKDHQHLIVQYQADIRQLEEKLQAARDKKRMLVQRHIHALHKKQAQREIRRANSTEAVLKFDELENRIERMEAEAELINYGQKPTLQTELEQLEIENEIENELQALKKKNVSAPKQTSGI
jgi:phage shock protein A